jgi:hypothetical protein
MGVAVITPDSPAVLKEVAAKDAINFPLLSDADSAVFRRYNLLSTAATGRAVGDLFLYPATLLLNAGGVVTARFFEQPYQAVHTIASQLARDGGPGEADAGARRSETRHLALVSSVSDPLVRPGTRFSLIVDVMPLSRMHVYAAGHKGHISIRLALERDDSFIAREPEYPAPEEYQFKPLGVTELVYNRPFRIVQEITVAFTPKVRARAQLPEEFLRIRGTVTYQACDDTVCYPPAEVPVEWTVRLASDLR